MRVLFLAAGDCLLAVSSPGPESEPAVWSLLTIALIY